MARTPLQAQGVEQELEQGCRTAIRRTWIRAPEARLRGIRWCRARGVKTWAVAKGTCPTAKETARMAKEIGRAASVPVTPPPPCSRAPPHLLRGQPVRLIFRPLLFGVALCLPTLALAKKPRLATLELHVVDANGEPVSHAVVTFCPEDDMEHRLNTVSGKVTTAFFVLPDRAVLDLVRGSVFAIEVDAVGYASQVRTIQLDRKTTRARVVLLEKGQTLVQPSGESPSSGPPTEAAPSLFREETEATRYRPGSSEVNALRRASTRETPTPCGMTTASSS